MWACVWARAYVSVCLARFLTSLARLVRFQCVGAYFVVFCCCCCCCCCRFFFFSFSVVSFLFVIFIFFVSYSLLCVCRLTCVRVDLYVRGTFIGCCLRAHFFQNVPLSPHSPLCLLLPHRHTHTHTRTQTNTHRLLVMFRIHLAWQWPACDCVSYSVRFACCVCVCVLVRALIFGMNVFLFHLFFVFTRRSSML